MSHTLTAGLRQALLSLGFLIAFTGVVVVLLLAAFEDMQHFSLKEEIKMKKIIKKNLLTFDERYELCMKIVRKINKTGNIHVKTYGQEYLSIKAVKTHTPSYRP